MLMLKSIIFIIFALILTTHQIRACSTSVQFEQGNLHFPEDELLKTATFFLEKLNYQVSASPEASQNVTIKLRPTYDYPQGRLKLALAMLTMKNNDEITAYTLGHGNRKTRESAAYHLREFKRAISRAISHLPICSESQEQK